MKRAGSNYIKNANNGTRFFISIQQKLAAILHPKMKGLNFAKVGEKRKVHAQLTGLVQKHHAWTITAKWNTDTVTIHQPFFWLLWQQQCWLMILKWVRTLHCPQNWNGKNDSMQGNIAVVISVKIGMKFFITSLLIFALNICYFSPIFLFILMEIDIKILICAHLYSHRKPKNSIYWTCGLFTAKCIHPYSIFLFKLTVCLPLPPTERSFSLAGYVMTARRNRLKPENLQAISRAPLLYQLKFKSLNWN